MHCRPLIVIALTVCALAWLAGCAAPGPQPEARSFPSSLPVEPGVLDIQVIHREQQIRMTNTTAQDFGPFDLWLNKWYVRPVSGLRIGESRTISLRDFRDEFSQTFRAGGFFATEAPEPVVAAHIEMDGRLHRLIVIPRRAQ